MLENVVACLATRPQLRNGKTANTVVVVMAAAAAAAVVAVAAAAVAMVVAMVVVVVISPRLAYVRNDGRNRRTSLALTRIQEENGSRYLRVQIHDSRCENKRFSLSIRVVNR